ncbi:Vacuolar aminopeptidase 1 [Yarrowia sp. C11]|nr:Vacuolar aminopeptidase 1 [Yarrowia sp. C11]KAG5364184.1 Vacuolar aminopeptidase 1 [Yarrowia sp. E02]
MQLNENSWKEQAERFMDFMPNAPTAYHACDLLAKDFDEAGYKELNERDEWDLTTHNKFYVRRNGSAIMGFVIGEDWTPGNGVGVVATHTDALCGRVKPISIKKPVDGYDMLGVAPYSGAFSSVWWDRDLGIGGRLIVRDESSKSVTSKLVHVPYPIARIPTLAPHFGAPANPPFNKETQMTPIIGLTSSKEVKEPTDEEKQSPMVGKHSIDLLRLLAKHAGVSVKDILQVELELFDTQEPVIGGLNHEFIFCPRVDDKLCTYTAVQGFIAAKHDDRALNIVACYDNEEVGSGTRQGAQGDLFQCIVERCVAHGMDSSVANLAAEYTRQTYANSFMVSADVGHAVNPNFSNAYLEYHKPQLNYGMTLKVYPNAATTSDAVSMALIEEIARRTDNKTQVMHTRNDTRAGGTLGKFLASATGMRAVDAGLAQLSMHSIRGTFGSKDIYLGTRFFRDFYSTWYAVDQEWKNGGI